MVPLVRLLLPLEPSVYTYVSRQDVFVCLDEWFEAGAGADLIPFLKRQYKGPHQVQVHACCSMASTYIIPKS